MKAEYDFSDAKRATTIDHLNRLREEQTHLLDDDVTNWLAKQDTTTKHHISEMIRQIMAIRQVTAH